MQSIPSKYRCLLPAVCLATSKPRVSTSSSTLGSNRGEPAERPCATLQLRGANLGEGGGRHLHSAFIRGVDLQVVPIGAVQPQQPAAGEASVVAWGMTTTMTATHAYADNLKAGAVLQTHSTRFCAWACLHVCACYLALQDTCSGRPCPAPRPALGQRGSARLPTSAPAAETDLPCVCLKGGAWLSGRPGNHRNKKWKRKEDPACSAVPSSSLEVLGCPWGR